MSTARIVAIALLFAGIAGLAYGGFTYANDRQEIRVGSMSMTVDHRRTVPVPVWAGVAAVVLGGGLLLASARKS